MAYPTEEGSPSSARRAPCPGTGRLVAVIRSVPRHCTLETATMSPSAGGAAVAEQFPVTAAPVAARRAEGGGDEHHERRVRHQRPRDRLGDLPHQHTGPAR